MDVQQYQVIVDDLQELVSLAKKVIYKIENAHRVEEKRELRGVLSSHLHSLAERLLLYTDALGLSATRVRLMEWLSDWSEADFESTEEFHTSEGSGIESPVLNRLLDIINPLGCLTSTRQKDIPHKKRRKDMPPNS